LGSTSTDGLASITFEKNDFITVENEFRVGDFDREYNGFLIEDQYDSKKVYVIDDYMRYIYLIDFNLSEKHLFEDAGLLVDFSKVQIEKRILQMNSHSDDDSYSISVYEIPFEIDWDENSSGTIDFGFFDSYEPVAQISGQYTNTMPGSSNIDYSDVTFDLTNCFKNRFPMNGLAFVFTAEGNRNYFYGSDLSIKIE
jgi:hypothetical protein